MRSNAISVAGKSFSFTMFGPSDGALSGSWCVSMKTAATPTATRTGTATNSRWRPLV